jgi:hypothetical protein
MFSLLAVEAQRISEAPHKACFVIIVLHTPPQSMTAEFRVQEKLEYIF